MVKPRNDNSVLKFRVISEFQYEFPMDKKSDMEIMACGEWMKDKKGNKDSCIDSLKYLRFKTKYST